MTMTGKKPAAKPVVQRHHRAAVLETCGLAVACVYLLALSPIPTWFAVAGLLIVGVCVALTVQALADSAHLGSSVGAWVLMFTGWLTYERVSRLPYALDTVAGLLFPSFLLCAATLAAYADVKAERRRQAADRRKREAAAALAGWGDMFTAMGVEGVAATKEEASRQGRDVTLRMPSSGKVTIATLTAKVDSIAVARNLQPGSVWFVIGRNSGEVIMHLDEKDILADAVPLPGDTSPLSVTQALGIGQTGEGDEVTVLFREVAVLVLGMMGMGKTNLLNVLISQLARCDNVIIFVIDLKGGRLPGPWIKPWIDGDCPRPVIDWVATDLAEAKRMLDAVDRVITARGESLAGGAKITPSRDNPQYVIITDEAGDFFEDLSPSERGDNPSKAAFVRVTDRITRKGRSEAVVPLWTTQRGTVSKLGSGDMKSQCRVRFALGTVSDADARQIVNDDYQASKMVAQLKHPGSGMVWSPGSAGRPVPVKFYRLDLDQGQDWYAEDSAKLARFATVGGHNRPAPDALSEHAMGDDYVRRWERSKLYQSMAQTSPAAPVLAQVNAPPPEPTAAEVNDAFTELMNAEGMGGAKPDPRGRMYALLADRPTMGLSVFEIRTQLDKEGLGVARETIHKWLRQDQDAEPPKIRKTGDGAQARYILIKPHG